MAHFIGLLQGQGNRLECDGSESTGIMAQASSQDVVVFVRGSHESTGDKFEIWITVNCDDEKHREDILAGIVEKDATGKYCYTP